MAALNTLAFVFLTVTLLQEEFGVTDVEFRVSFIHIQLVLAKFITFSQIITS